MPPRPGAAKPDAVFVAPSLMRKVVAFLGLVALVGAGWAGWRAYQEQSTTDLVVAVGAVVVGLVAWVLLATTVPQRVVITGSVIEIIRGSSTQRYDLEDPSVDMLVRDGSVAFGHYRDNWTIVQARDVEWREFMDIVMRYQFQADINAEERDKRFSR